VAPPPGFSSGRLFSPPQPSGLGQPSGLADDVDLLAPGVRGDATAFDDPDGFDSLSYLRHEPTPALLAAKAEPLGDPTPSRRTPRAKPAGKQAKAGRPAKTGSRPAGPATRSNRSGRAGAPGEAGRSPKSRAQVQQAARRKPKEPSKGLLALAAVGVILIGVAAGYWLTNRNNDDGAGTVAGPTATTAPGATTAPSTSVAGDPATTVATGAAPTGPKPAVVFNEAAAAPVLSTQAYTITVRDAPADATSYLLKVDDQPVGEPAPQLAPYQFTPGRHLLQIEISGPSGTTATDPVVVYALGETPGRTYRANLSSVATDPNQANGGWAEAVKQFDAFYAAGHTNVKLMPSDPYPSLKPGYWNIFVDGFADSAAAEAYCTERGLAVPTQCFPKLFDPNAPAPAPASGG